MAEHTADGWSFRVFVVGGTVTGDRAVANLQHLVATHLANGAEIEVVDLKEAPERALEERVVTVPTVVRLSPGPEKRVVGDLSDPELARRGLNLPPPTTA